MSHAAPISSAALQQRLTGDELPVTASAAVAGLWLWKCLCLSLPVAFAFLFPSPPVSALLNIMSSSIMKIWKCVSLLLFFCFHLLPNGILKSLSVFLSRLSALLPCWNSLCVCVYIEQAEVTPSQKYAPSSHLVPCLARPPPWACANFFIHHLSFQVGRTPFGSTSCSLAFLAALAAWQQLHVFLQLACSACPSSSK